MKNLKINKKKGFSLVELLVVIAVIGVIAAIAIPAMSGIFGSSQAAKAKRNAQNIASVYASAVAAGASVKPTVTGAPGVDAISLKLKSGAQGAGPFISSYFKLSMDDDELDKAKTYLSYDLSQDTLTYLAPVE